MLVLIVGGVAIRLASTWKSSALQLVPGRSWLVFAAGMLYGGAAERRWFAPAEL